MPPSTNGSKLFQFLWIYEPWNLPIFTKREIIEIGHANITKESISGEATNLKINGFNHRVISTLEYAVLSAKTGEPQDSKLYFHLEYGHPEREFSHHPPWPTLRGRVSIQVEEELFEADLLESHSDVFRYWDWTRCYK